jgi:hypothetical protein
MARTVQQGDVLHSFLRNRSLGQNNMTTFDPIYDFLLQESLRHSEHSRSIVLR